MNEHFSEERAKQNKTALLCMSMTNIVLLICYGIEFAKGKFTWLYFAIFCVLAIFPILTGIGMYRKNKDAERLGAAISTAFLVLYAFIMVMTTTQMSYVYGMLIALALVCYSNIKLTNGFVLGLIVINIAQLVVTVIRGELSNVLITDIEIRFASLLFFALFATLVTRTMEYCNRKKMEVIEAEKDNASAMTKKVLQVAEKMSDNIASIKEKTVVMEDLADKNLSAMEEVTHGNNETVNSVQMQLIRTNDIKEAIGQVTMASSSIVENVEDTKQELAESKANIDSLIDHVNISYQSNENVSKELAELTRYTTQMEDIIGMINGITSQTSLLSLNASIEAARAGEAGRGFAVVASEISNLANQTQEATVNITDLIKNISGKLTQVVSVVQEMIENANEQNEAASQTADSFDKISEKTNQVAKHVEDMSKLVLGLSEANNEIVKGIETISAVAQEVTANSNMTYESSSENKRVSVEIADLVAELNDAATELTSVQA